MLIEDFEEEIRRRKRKKKITYIIIAIIWGGFAAVLLYNRFFTSIFFTGDMVIQNKETEKKEEIIVFYPVEGLRLTKKTLSIQKGVQEKTRLELALKSLKEIKAIPEGLMLYECALDERGIVYANFSKHLIEETKEPKKEIIAVFSLVNTLISNMANAKAVQFLIEGQPVHTLNGIIYTYNPISFNDSLVED